MLTRRRGVPVTTPQRTISDLRGAVSPSVVRQAIRQAEVLGLSIEPSEARDGTRSELEHRFLTLCRRHHLPAPKVNARVGAMTVDFFWPERRLVVETDGYRYHRGRTAFEDDRARDLSLRGRGFEVVRLSHRQVMDEPARVAAVLRAVIEGRRP